MPATVSSSQESSPSLPKGVFRLSTEPFSECLSFLDTSELARSRLVSKAWRDVIDGPSGEYLWKQRSIDEGVPLVAGKPFEKRDFRFLRSLTYGKRLIGQFLGKVEGDVPLLSQQFFNRLKEGKDPYNGELMCRTWRILVDYPSVEVTVGPNRPLYLDPVSGNLAEVPAEARADMKESTLTVPFTFENIVPLAKYALAGSANGPVFGRVFPLVKGSYGVAPEVVTLRPMRINVPDSTRNLTIDRQKEKVRECGYEVMDVRELSIPVAIEILCSQTCPHGRSSWARGNAEFTRGDHQYVGIIGGFAPGVGVFVDYTPSDSAFDSGGVVPGVPAEGLRP